MQALINPVPPSSTSPDEEIAKYNFRKGASMALGGSVGGNTAKSAIPAKPVITSKKKNRIFPWISKCLQNQYSRLRFY